MKRTESATILNDNCGVLEKPKGGQCKKQDNMRHGQRRRKEALEITVRSVLDMVYS